MSEESCRKLVVPVVDSLGVFLLLTLGIPVSEGKTEKVKTLVDLQLYRT